MTEPFSRPCTAFDGHKQLGAGPLAQVALVVKRAKDSGHLGPILVFDDVTGRVIDLDLRAMPPGNMSTPPGAPDGSAVAPEPHENRGRGRPKLGVVGREITLLPRQWDWLATQPGGASVVIRKLVDQAKRASEGLQSRRSAQDAAYQFMHAIAGDLPGFEEALRALFADNSALFHDQIAAWPKDIRDYASHLGFGLRADS
jgi:hypothetical protein